MSLLRQPLYRVTLYLIWVARSSLPVLFNKQIGVCLVPEMSWNFSKVSHKNECLSIHQGLPGWLLLVLQEITTPYKCAQYSLLPKPDSCLQGHSHSHLYQANNNWVLMKELNKVVIDSCDYSGWEKALWTQRQREGDETDVCPLLGATKENLSEGQYCICAD